MQSSTTWWDSRWARRLDYVAAVAAALILLRVASEEDLSWILWACLGLVILSLSFVRWPYGALTTLIAVSAMPRFYVELSRWKVRPEHFGSVIVALAAGIWLVKKKLAIKIEALDYWVVAYLAVNYFSSAFTSPMASSTLKWALMNNLAVLPYFLVRLLVHDIGTLQKAFRLLLGVAISEAAYGILCYLSHLLYRTTTGVEVGQYLGNVAAPYGSLYEPNLFGAYTACCAVMMLTLYFMNKHNRIFYMASFLIASVATFFSFSRAAVMALILITGWVLWKGRRRGANTRRTLLIFALALVLIVAVILTAIGDVLQQRLNDLFTQGLTEETTLTRLVVLAEAMTDIFSHPVFGTGTASFQLFFDWANFVPEWAGTATWIGNFLVRVLHDTGIFGLAALLGFMVSLVWKIKKGLRSVNVIPVLFALSAGALIYLITFQFTDGSTLAFCWLHLGFLATAAILTVRSSDESSHAFAMDS